MDKTCKNCLFKIFDDEKGKYICEMDLSIDTDTIVFCEAFEERYETE
jgi:hypothetical protein